MKEDKRLARRVRYSYVISTISISLVLFMLGAVSYLMIAAMGVASDLQESLTVMVEVKNSMGDEERSQFEQMIKADSLVKSYQFSSKEDKIADPDFRAMFDSHIESILERNPLLDSYDITLSKNSADSVALHQFLGRIEQTKGIEKVSYPMNIAEELHSTVGKVRNVLIMFSLSLLVISLILLGNTIRLTVFSKRYLINTMKLVGATRWFIMKPFLKSAMLQGAVAGVLASLLFMVAKYWMGGTVPELSVLASDESVVEIVVGMILGGVAISLVFSALAVNRFVNVKSNKIHLY